MRHKRLEHGRRDGQANGGRVQAVHGGDGAAEKEDEALTDHAGDLEVVIMSQALLGGGDSTREKGGVVVFIDCGATTAWTRQSTWPLREMGDRTGPKTVSLRLEDV